MMPTGILIWAEIVFRGVDLGALAQQSLGRLRTHFGSLDLHEFATSSRLYRESPGRAVFERLLAAHRAPVTGRGLASETETLLPSATRYSPV